MTREEAINKISELVVYARTQGWDDDYTEAFEMLEQEHCEDAISRQAVLDVLIRNRVHFCDVVKITSELKELPSVTPKQKIGYWIRHHEPYTWMGWATWSCSECDFYTNSSAKNNYCPHCGARMEGSERA